MAKRRVRATLAWVVLAGVVALAAMFLYCASLFPELQPLMERTPRLRPSTIYSDVYVLHKGDDLSGAFLAERLEDSRIPFTKDGGSFAWKATGFDYPASILPMDSPLRLPAGRAIRVAVAAEAIASIQVEGQEVAAVAIDPAPVAQLAGASHAIRDNVKLDAIPTRLLQAIIAIEDQRFLEHPGFDLKSVARALWVNLRMRAMSQGGSTLTQQLVKNLMNTRQKTLFRKARELILAILLEARYTKEQILEKYLNEVYFGQIGSLEVHGVSEAARYFFDKPLDRLALGEMALMAGVIRGPGVYSPYKNFRKASERRDTVLRKMDELRLITRQERDQALSERIALAPPALLNNRAPYFADYVKSQVLEQLHEGITAEDLSAEGLRIFTTLDLPLQRRADRAVAATVRELEARYKLKPPLRLEGVLVAAEHRSGFIRALVGGRSYAETTFNRALNMKRQAGSTFKPIAYLAALLKGSDPRGVPYTGAYLVDDEPWTYRYGRQSWSPRNYEKGYRGRITLREAFANSINIPMARIGTDVGIDRVIEAARGLGIRSELPEIPSLVLGSVDLSPIEMLEAYSTLANRGNRVELTAVRAVVDESDRPVASFVPRAQQAIDAPVVDVLNDFLRSVVKEGTAKALPALGYSKAARGKTGTTSFSRDAWFAGFSQGLAAVSWTGFDELRALDPLETLAAANENGVGGAAVARVRSPAPLTGAGAALPAWARFFAAARPSKLEEIEAPPDPSLETRKIDRSTGLLAKPSCPAGLVYEELFLPGTAPSAKCSAH